MRPRFRRSIGRQPIRAAVSASLLSFLLTVTSSSQPLATVLPAQAGTAPRPAQGPAPVLKDQALRKYLVTDGNWEWKEDKGRPFAFESGGRADNPWDWEQLSIEATKVSMYSYAPTLVGAFCGRCGIQVNGSYTIHGDQLTIRSTSVRVISRDAADIGTVDVAFVRIGKATAVADDGLAIEWKDGTTTRYKRLRFPS